MLIMVAKLVHGWIILQYLMFCPSLLLTDTPSRMLLVQITVLLHVAFNFDQLPMTHTVERPKNKHINWKLEYVGVKRQFYERLDNMIDAAPGDYCGSTGART